MGRKGPKMALHKMDWEPTVTILGPFGGILPCVLGVDQICEPPDQNLIHTVDIQAVLLLLFRHLPRR